MAAISSEVYTSLGLNESEYARIVQLMGRDPNAVELAMFSVMWSEHCGYKYSRQVLSRFGKYKEALEGKGLENAGIVDIGDGLGVTMKVESHNHPSAVEPYQGAATGVGGIIRDILTMGARPVALLNSLRFGPVISGQDSPDHVQRNRYLFSHVVEGIGGYGNCVGVPTVAGEVGFHKRYSGNPLVNAMCVGVLDLRAIATAAARGVGNPVLYLGSATGKDGIHGATFASDALDEGSEAKRPNVQIGDPFAGKLLIEATLEALKTGAIVAIQDMGAAGLTCSTIEMSAKGQVGMEIELDLVPTREAGMTPVELMLSESQERMLAVAHAGRELEVIAVFRKWGLHAVVIGNVTSERNVVVRQNGEVVATLDPLWLANECPTYSTDAEAPDYHAQARSWAPQDLNSVNLPGALLQLLSSPNLSSKKWVFQQYDQQVQTQTQTPAGKGDAAVIDLRGTKKALALKIDGNARQVYFDPRVGGQLAVCEAARNVACVGARPVAVTDGLNFGNPQRPHVFWQFREAVEGIAEACEVFGTPVISGNVSFYNESDLGEVLPTPLIGMLGVIDDAAASISMVPRNSTGFVVMLQVPHSNLPQQGLGASEFLAAVLGVENGCPEPPNLAAEKTLCEVLVGVIGQGWLEWAHDLSEGGLLVAAAEVCAVGRCGMELDFGNVAFSGSGYTPLGRFASPASALFGEVSGRVLAGIDLSKRHIVEQLDKQARENGLEVVVLGMYARAAKRLQVKQMGQMLVDVSTDEISRAYEATLALD